jgi:hypothetical protein
MKNLPNKIYLNFGDITKKEFEESDYNEFCKLDEFAVTFCEDRVYDTDVEYIRTDAFIEKACEWLDNNIWAYIEIMHPTVDSYTRIRSERLICDFKKVMRR